MEQKQIDKTKKLIIIGAGGHGKVAAEIASLQGYGMVYFLDDDPSVEFCMDYPVIGEISKAKEYSDFDFFVGIGNAETREKIQKQVLLWGLRIVTLIHPSAIISEHVRIGMGTVVMAGAIINTETYIGEGCIVNTGATIDHDCLVKDYAHISVGVHLAGGVDIGKYTWVGIGTIVNNNIHICDNCMLGAGAVVVNNIVEAGMYIGIPAKKIEKKQGC